MSSSTDEIAGIILAGGKSLRYGQDKAFISLNGVFLIERVISVMRQVFQDVILIANEVGKYAGFGLPVYEDVIKGIGPIGGILTGMLWIQKIQKSAGFFVACDMPFLNPELIAYMVKIRDGFDVVIPRIGKNIEPLHAIYTKNCIPYIEESIHKKNYGIRTFFPKVSVRYVEKDEIMAYDPELKFLININTPEDIRRFRLNV